MADKPLTAVQEYLAAREALRQFNVLIREGSIGSASALISVRKSDGYASLGRLQAHGLLHVENVLATHRLDLGEASTTHKEEDKGRIALLDGETFATFVAGVSPREMRAKPDPSGDLGIDSPSQALLKDLAGFFDESEKSVVDLGAEPGSVQLFQHAERIHAAYRSHGLDTDPLVAELPVLVKARNNNVLPEYLEVRRLDLWKRVGTEGAPSNFHQDPQPEKLRGYWLGVADLLDRLESDPKVPGSFTKEVREHASRHFHHSADEWRHRRDPGITDPVRVEAMNEIFDLAEGLFPKVPPPAQPTSGNLRGPHRLSRPAPQALPRPAALPLPPPPGLSPLPRFDLPPLPPQAHLGYVQAPLVWPAAPAPTPMPRPSRSAERTPKLGDRFRAGITWLAKALAAGLELGPKSPPRTQPRRSVYQGPSALSPGSNPGRFTSSRYPQSRQGRDPHRPTTADRRSRRTPPS